MGNIVIGDELTKFKQQHCNNNKVEYVQWLHLTSWNVVDTVFENHFTALHFENLLKKVRGRCHFHLFHKKLLMSLHSAESRKLREKALSS